MGKTVKSITNKSLGAVTGGVVGEDVYGLDLTGAGAAADAAKKAARAAKAGERSAAAERAQAYDEVSPALNQFLHPAYQQAFAQGGLSPYGKQQQAAYDQTGQYGSRGMNPYNDMGQNYSQGGDTQYNTGGQQINPYSYDSSGNTALTNQMTGPQAQGQMPQGQMPQGQMPQGQMPQGQAPQSQYGPGNHRTPGLTPDQQAQLDAISGESYQRDTKFDGMKGLLGNKFGGRANLMGEHKFNTDRDKRLADLQGGFDESNQAGHEQRLNTYNQPQGFGFGYDPMSQLNAAAGAAGPEAQAAWYRNMQEDPATAFLRQQGMRNMTNSSSATGGLGGGSRLKALSQFNQGLASQDIGNRLGQLGSLASTNIGLATGLGNLRTGLGNANAQSAQNLGQIDSNRITNIGNQKSQQFGQLVGAGGAALGAFSDERLKTNIVKIDEEHGFNVYKWDWKEEAEDIVGDQNSIGLMAQEVIKTHPEAVYKDEASGYLKIDYEFLGETI